MPCPQRGGGSVDSDGHYVVYLAPACQVPMAGPGPQTSGPHSGPRQAAEGPEGQGGPHPAPEGRRFRIRPHPSIPRGPRPIRGNRQGKRSRSRQRERHDRARETPKRPAPSSQLRPPALGNPPRHGATPEPKRVSGHTKKNTQPQKEEERLKRRKRRSERRQSSSIPVFHTFLSSVARRIKRREEENNPRDTPPNRGKKGAGIFTSKKKKKG